MRKQRWLWLPALLLGLMAGCCANPGIFQKVEGSLETVQSFYEVLTKQDLSQNEGLQRAVVAADSALLLAGQLQQQWCPEANQAKQLELQTGAAQKMAQEAGVTAAGPQEPGK